MDYPSAQNYIAPIYGEGAGLADFGYNSEEANAEMRAGNTAETIDEGLEHYNAAEDLILDTFPVIPIYFGNNLAAYNDNLSGVAVDKFSNIDLLSVSVSDVS
jgi:oligopeptide transport system substrate-binding protein